MIRPMIRKLVAVAAMLAVSACVTSGSTFDVAPKEARYSRAPIPSGQWCTVDGDTPDTFVVESKSETCFRMQWRGGKRIYVMSARNPEGPESLTAEVGFSPLGAGLMLGQLDARTVVMTPEEEGRDMMKDMPPYVHTVYLASGDAIASIPFSVTDEQVDALAARHPAIKLQGTGTSRVATAGTREQVLAYLRELTRMSLKEEPQGVTFMVRDREGAPNHPPSTRQAADIARVIDAYRALPR